LNETLGVVYWQQRSLKCFALSRHTDRMRFDNATRFFSFWKLIKQPMRANFERYIEQITQILYTKYLENLHWDQSYRSVKIEKSRRVSNRIRCVWTFNLYNANYVYFDVIFFLVTTRRLFFIPNLINCNNVSEFTPSSGYIYTHYTYNSITVRINVTWWWSKLRNVVTIY
jgi:hypothetical protein